VRLSYAQNLEDYHLDLMFAGQQSGTYVDVGGGHPVADNVSFWFYLKGWRGLIVEPQAGLAEAYRHIRPRDTVYCGLAGAESGEADFHVVAGLHGLSSMVRDQAESANQFGASYSTVRSPVGRLDELVREAGLARIDFLKIDVEGAEDMVLAGLDMTVVRPRVIVVEAVNPTHPDGAPGPWEVLLTSAGYRFVFFDRLNRFYVAPGEDDLAARLPSEPAPWNAVDHLWDHGRAPHNPQHADHELARIVERGVMALLPSLPSDLLARIVELGLGQSAANGGGLDNASIARLLGAAEYPGSEPIPRDLAELFASDQFRAALGRIACFYDGGHIVEES
jgi:FkbM family methyltransferase